jgi:hypothetical protein
MRSLTGRVFVSLGVLASMYGGQAMASGPATTAVTGLGQAWPNAPDVSASPHYHVYVFQKQGVRYVQINDAAGTVRGAVALVGGEALDLPIGVDANPWQPVSEDAAPAAGEAVYRDDAVTITAAPQSNGSVRLLLAPGNCDDPSKCSIRGP